MADAPILSVEGLTTEFETRTGAFAAITDVSFTLRRGEVLGLVGESGSGKSVTGLSLIGLIDPPGRIAAGRVMFDGRDLRRLDPEALRRLRGARIAMVFQDPMMTLNPTLTIETQMVEAIAAHRKTSRRAARARAIEMLAKVGIPAPETRIGGYPHQFSGGMRQRVAIAIALINDPDVIIADEPTTALDVTIQAQILEEVRRICRENGTALIWITHDLAVIADLADRVCVMYAGRIVEEGTIGEVIGAAQHPYTRGLIDSIPSRNPRGAPLKQIPGAPLSPAQAPAGCAFQPRCPRAAERCRILPELAVMATGGRARCHFPLGVSAPPIAIERAEPAPSPALARTGRGDTPILEIAGVSKSFTDELDMLAKLARLAGAKVRHDVVHAVDDVSLALAEGEVVGLVGESGCGKSTLARIAAGIVEASGGEVRFRGEPVTRQDKARGKSAALKLQMIFQDPMSSLNPRLRVREIVGEAPVKHGLVARADLDGYLDALLARVGLDGSIKERLPHQFSGGQRQRLGIARALAVSPEILICDEAISALDVSIQAQILNLFIRLRDELDLALLFISHDLGAVRHVSDRIVVMYLGRFVEIAEAEALFAAPNHPYTQALLAAMPSLDKRRTIADATRGELPSPLAPPAGCHFHPRCPHAFARCRTEPPPLKAIAPGRWAACHLNDLQ